VSETYVHGYHPRENERLHDQAGSLSDPLHSDTAYPGESSVLEVGCGVGAQTLWLARQSPTARFLSIDISADSISEARSRVERAGLANVEFRQADIFALPFPAESFDHVFVCFVLEHLARPSEALLIFRRLLRSGGSFTVIEGDHGSTYFHPHSPDAHADIACLVEIQRRAGGNALIGRHLHYWSERDSMRSACPRGWCTWTRAVLSSSTASPERRSPRWSRASATLRWRRA
jgi:SAM-dependent methyltransferase